MEAVMIYKASDGSRFDDAESCRQYEDMVAAVADAVAPLGERPDLPHGGWIKHTRNACFQARRGLVAVARNIYSPERYPVFANDPDTIHPMSAAGRIVNDGGNACLYRAWQRLMCISWESFKEYEQPYFTRNEHEAAKRETARPNL